ncbi:HupE/UreJ family protein [Bordetella bronchialis]|uniref:Urease accessory protein UreJ n=1 Tax=Bordetella bronchialis TaxID=463025 RepID=A0A193FKQ7_9BORD|nr:HupE/UreJ family protein [Bordetella bronchialis]ANN67823.1 urease accessory protein UreJ [Bordetella bronchialis]ANN72916.1 urease accessory protein UreJ [Bordetella bronchialis]
MNRSRIAAIAAWSTLLVAGAAGAHPLREHIAEAAGMASSAVAGLLHPLTGLDHLCAMIAVGMWSAMTARRVWLAPLSFAAVLLLGALVGLARVPMPAVEPMIAASLLVLGLLVAARARLPEWAGAAIAALFAFFHGHAHGHELPEAASAGAYIAGFMAATVGLHCAGIAAGVALRQAHAWLPRIAGLGVALYGAVLLAA